MPRKKSYTKQQPNITNQRNKDGERELEKQLGATARQQERFPLERQPELRSLTQATATSAPRGKYTVRWYMNARSNASKCGHSCSPMRGKVSTHVEKNLSEFVTAKKCKKPALGAVRDDAFKERGTVNTR